MNMIQIRISLLSAWHFPIAHLTTLEQQLTWILDMNLIKLTIKVVMGYGEPGYAGGRSKRVHVPKMMLILQ